MQTLETHLVSHQQMHQGAALHQDLMSAQSWTSVHRTLLGMYSRWKDSCLGRYLLSLRNVLLFLQMLKYHRTEFFGGFISILFSRQS